MKDVMVQRILILAANPKNSSRLRLDAELREIEDGLVRAKRRDQFELVQKWAVRPRDLQRAILEVNPYIVHFSGHGVGENGLVLENDVGEVKLISAAALEDLFELFSAEIECLLLNACYSEVQAEAISQHIPYVIGMNKAIGDNAALAFSVGFYDALGAGKSIEFAYKFACNAIHINGINEHLTPVLMKKTSQFSSVYVERPPLERNCYEAMLRPCMVRIKASSGMGKTMLLQKIIAHASDQENFKTVILSFNLVEKEIYSTVDTFLKWFCANVSSQIGLENKVEELWRDMFGSTSNCLNYFKKYLLQKINVPIVVGIDQIDLLFSYPETGSSFFGLLKKIFQDGILGESNCHKLRFFITHTQDINFPSNLNQSPFHIGDNFALRGFNELEVQALIEQSGISWNMDSAKPLMKMVGGNPHLLRMAISHANASEMSLEKVLKEASTEQGVYATHLRRHLVDLEQDQDLFKAYSEVVYSDEPIKLAAPISLKLTNMGLAKYAGERVMTACELYQKYFEKQLISS